MDSSLESNSLLRGVGPRQQTSKGSTQEHTTTTATRGWASSTQRESTRESEKLTSILLRTLVSASALASRPRAPSKTPRASNSADSPSSRGSKHASAVAQQQLAEALSHSMLPAAAAALSAAAASKHAAAESHSHSSSPSSLPPVLSVPPTLSSRALFASEQEDAVARLPSLAMHAQFVAGVWRESRALTLQKKVAQAQAEQALKTAQAAQATALRLAKEKAEERKSLSPLPSPLRGRATLWNQPSPPQQPAPASASGSPHAHRPSFAFSSLGLLNPPSSSAAMKVPSSPAAVAAAAAIAVAVAAAPAAETLASIDSLLDPQSLVHVAAAMNVDQLLRKDQQRNNNQKHSHDGSIRPLNLSMVQSQNNSLPMGHPSAQQQSTHQHHMQQQQQQTGSQSARTLPSSSVSLRQQHSASAASLSEPNSPNHSNVEPQHQLHASSSSPFLRHLVSSRHAWHSQLAYLAQDIFYAKCADLSMSAASASDERRDKFIARILDVGARDDVLRLVAQGLGKHAARAVALFLRKVQAYAMPTPQELAERNSVSISGAAPKKKRANNTKKNKRGGGLHSRGSGGTGGGLASGEHSSQLDSADDSGATSSDTDDEEEDPSAARAPIGAHLSQEELLRLSFESSQKSPSMMNSPAAVGNVDFRAGFESVREEDAEADQDQDPDAEADEDAADGSDAEETKRKVANFNAKFATARTFPAAGAGVGQGELLMDSAAEVSSVEGAIAHAAASGDPSVESQALDRARKLLPFHRHYFHALDLTGNATGDEGALELSVLFLPSARQLQADAAAAALGGSKSQARAERKRRRRERRARRAQARKEGRDPDLEVAAQDELEEEDEDAPTLTPLSGLKSLTLRSNNLTASGFATLFDSLAHSRAPLTFLDLSAHSAAAASINAASPVAPTVTVLGGSSSSGIGLGQMFIGLEGCHALSLCLLKNTTLRTLLLHNVGLGTIPQGLEFLAAGLKGNRTLIHLDLGANKIAGGASAAMTIAGAQAAREFQTLCLSLRGGSVRHLVLSHNPLGSIGAASVAQYLAAAPNLTNLVATDCAFGVGGLALLTAAIGTEDAGGPAVLAEVHLDFNAFNSPGGPAGGRPDPAEGPALAKLLMAQAGLSLGACVSPRIASNLSLHSLQLSNCGIDDRVVTELAAALEGHHTMHTLSLRCNRIGDAGALALAALLRANRVLDHLDCQSNFIGDVGGIALASALGKASPCYWADLSLNSMTNRAAEAFLWALHANPVLSHINLDGNAFDFKHAAALKEVQTHNKRAYTRNYLRRLYRTVSRLLRAKAKFNNVLSQRDQAAHADRRATEYLAELVETRKAHEAHEAKVTDDLISEMARMKGEIADLATAARQISVQIASESTRTAARIREQMDVLAIEQNHVRILRRRLAARDFSSGPNASGSGAAASGMARKASVNHAVTSSTGPPAMPRAGSNATATSPAAAATGSTVASSSAAAASIPASEGTTVECTNAETVLRSETRKLEASRSEAADQMRSLQDLIAAMEAKHSAAIGAAAAAAASHASTKHKSKKKHKTGEKKHHASKKSVRKAKAAATPKGLLTPKPAVTRVPSLERTPSTQASQ